MLKREKFKILVDAFAAREGGGKWFTGALLSELARQNKEWRFWIYCSDENFSNIFKNFNSVEVCLIREAKNYCSRLAWQQFKLRHEIKKNQIDLLFSPMNVGILHPPIPQVTVQRNAHHLVNKVSRRNGGRWIVRRLQLMGSLASIKSSRENIFVSGYLLDMARKWIKNGHDHWHVIYNSINTDRFKAHPKPVFKGSYLLCVGSITPHKNVDTLIQAFKIALPFFKEDVKLVLAGAISEVHFGSFGRYKEYLFKLVADLSLINSVVFTGPVGGSMLTSLYKRATAWVVPSLLESFGVVPAESLYCRTPCLVADIPVFHEVYQNSVLYCNPYSAVDISKMLIRIMEDTTSRQELLSHWDRIMPNFLLSNTAKKYSYVLKRAMNLSN